MLFSINSILVDDLAETLFYNVFICIAFTLVFDNCTVRKIIISKLLSRNSKLHSVCRILTHCIV